MTTEALEIANRICDFIYSDEGRQSTDEQQVSRIASIVSGWIKCEDKMPDIGQNVIVVSNSWVVQYQAAFWNGTDWEWVGALGEMCDTVPREAIVAWKIWPTPPREEER